MKAFVVAAFAISGLLLLVAWPVFVFSLAFIDEPPRHPLHGFTIAFQIYSTLAYPIIWAIALFCAVTGVKMRSKKLVIAASAAPFVLMLATVAGRRLW